MIDAVQPGPAAGSPAAPPALPAAPAGVASPLSADGYAPEPAAEQPEENRIRRKVLAPMLRKLAQAPLTAGLLQSISRKSEPLPTDEQIENLRRVSPQILRGGQPGPLGYQLLAKQHIRASLDLAAEHQEEAAFLPKLGIKSLSLPIAPFGPPTIDQAVEFLRMALNPANHPLYVHCYHGVDRTGAMMAVYRIVHDKWSADDAITEMRQLGLNEDYHQDKVAFVRRFAAAWADPDLRRQVYSGLPPAAINPQ